jgi:putative ABC transport system ATP-binding protein
MEGDAHHMITIQNIGKIYNKGTANQVTALNDVTLTINKEEYVVIVGPNGSGKTTLLNIIAGAEMSSIGKVQFDNEDVTRLPDYQRSRWVARVFQNPLMGTASELSILDNFRLAAIRTCRKSLSIGVNGAFRKQVQDKIATLNMGLENKVEQSIGTLSGGQRQALTLLMSVMDHTEILLLDEPTAALDPRSAATVLQLADNLIKQYNLTAILITHSLKDAHQFGNRLIQMNEGKVVRDLNEEAKTKTSLEELFKWFE